MTKTYNKMIVIEKTDRSVEKVSCSCVVLAPNQRSKEDMEKILKPTKVKDMDQEYTAKKDINLKYFGTINHEKDDTGEIYYDEASCKEMKQKKYRKGESDTCHVFKKETQKEEKDGAPTEDFVIENIVDYKINISRMHRYGKAGEPLYFVRWYGYNIDDDKWKPTRHLPRSKLLSYYRKNKILIPDSINRAEYGRSMHIPPTNCCLDF